MEHDEQCERVDLMSAVIRRMDLRDSEADELMDTTLTSCGCALRAQGRDLTYDMTLNMVRMLVNEVENRRRLRRKDERTVRGEKTDMVIIDEPDSAQIIHVDFQNRRRVDGND